MAISVTLLGTGSPVPDPNRGGAATLVRTGDAILLVDAGRACIMRLTAAGVLPPMLTGVLLTHLHSDHITDLNDVVTTHWVMSPDPTPLRVYGPRGTKEVVDALRAMLALDEGYRIAHHDDLNEGPRIEVSEVEAAETLSFGGTTVSVHPTDHRPVEPSVGYRVEHEGTVAAIAGDTVPCPGLETLCAGADVYVQTVIRDDLVRMIPAPRIQDILDYHSTVADAGRTAAEAGVGTLVLTHYVPTLVPGQEDDWRALAAEHFDGEILLGDDLLTVEVAEPRGGPS